MSASTDSKKAAQYVRMSTDYQQYSTANQKAAIAAYAASHGIEIVITYEDSGKSGLTISGRPALRQLIADIAAGQAVFDTILVYDVSRWGRFQDADESAHLEYLCRLGGVRLEYCAEPFSNDGTPFASICKVVKRALAAEYSRELSEKVFRGKRRLIELGFRQGGSPGIGLRRCLVDSSGRRKAILKRGEYKSIATDRVILIPGPPEEIAIVDRIYRDYVERGLGSIAIAEALNRDSVRSESGRPWSKAVVKRVLTSEKYIGDSVWARSSFKLQIVRQLNPQESWARFDGAFEPIIGRSLFEQAQKIRAARSAKLTDEQIVARLRAIYRKHGRITARLVKKDRFISVAAIRRRFGSLIPAYELAGHRPERDLAFLANNRTAQHLRATIADAILAGLRSRGQEVERLSGACRFLVNHEIRITVTVAQQRRSQRGHPRWLVKPAMGIDDLRIAVLMDGHSERAHAYYFFPSAELRKECLLSLRNPADLEALRSNDLEPLFALCARQRLGQADLGAFTTDAPPPYAALPERPVRKTRSQPQTCKTYSGAFSRASRQMRDAINRTTAVALRLDMLRQTLAKVVLDPNLREILRAEGIETVPYALRRPERHIEELGERFYRARLWEAAMDLLGNGGLSRRARMVLAKLNDRSRAEAAEVIILVNDMTEEFARALVAATPTRGLRDASRKHIYGADPRRLKTMVAEREHLLRMAKPAFASFGRNALDLVAVEVFARRLMAIRSVVTWLTRHDTDALYSLSLIR
jgi:DNA invertase Pin-like site-specific DNA recombinase